MERIGIHEPVMTEIAESFFSTPANSQSVNSSTLIQIDWLKLKYHIQEMLDYKAVPDFKNHPCIVATSDNSSSPLLFYVKQEVCDKIHSSSSCMTAKITMSDIHPISQFVTQHFDQFHRKTIYHFINPTNY